LLRRAFLKYSLELLQPISGTIAPVPKSHPESTYAVTILTFCLYFRETTSFSVEKSFTWTF
jgi:hypothetical protein